MSGRWLGLVAFVLTCASAQAENVVIPQLEFSYTEGLGGIRAAFPRQIDFLGAVDLRLGGALLEGDLGASVVSVTSPLQR